MRGRVTRLHESQQETRNEKNKTKANMLLEASSCSLLLQGKYIKKNRQPRKASPYETIIALSIP